MISNTSLVRVLLICVIIVSGCSSQSSSEDEASNASECPAYDSGLDAWMTVPEIMQIKDSMSDGEIQQCAEKVLSHSWLMQQRNPDWTLDLTGIKVDVQASKSVQWVTSRTNSFATGTTVIFKTDSNCKTSPTCIPFFQGTVTIKGTEGGRSFEINPAEWFVVDSSTQFPDQRDAIRIWKGIENWVTLLDTPIDKRGTRIDG